MNHLLAGLFGLMEMQNSLFSVMYLRKLQSMVTLGNVILRFSSLSFCFFLTSKLNLQLSKTTQIPFYSKATYIHYTLSCSIWSLGSKGIDSDSITDITY